MTRQDNPYDLTQEADVVAYMEQAQTVEDWNARCDDVKRVNGDYPRFWFEAIILSGLHKRVAKRWGSDGEMKVITF